MLGNCKPASKKIFPYSHAAWAFFVEVWLYKIKISISFAHVYGSRISCSGLKGKQVWFLYSSRCCKYHEGTYVSFKVLVLQRHCSPKADGKTNQKGTSQKTCHKYCIQLSGERPSDSIVLAALPASSFSYFFLFAVCIPNQRWNVTPACMPCF